MAVIRGRATRLFRKVVLPIFSICRDCCCSYSAAAAPTVLLLLLLLETAAPTNLVGEHGLVHLERRLGAVGLDASHVVREAARQRPAQSVHLFEARAT